jgi:hypothetical protein
MCAGLTENLERPNQLNPRRRIRSAFEASSKCRLNSVVCGLSFLLGYSTIDQEGVLIRWKRELAGPQSCDVCRHASVPLLNPTDSDAQYSRASCKVREVNISGDKLSRIPLGFQAQVTQVARIVRVPCRGNAGSLAPASRS